jgi:hypothetical protein
MYTILSVYSTAREQQGLIILYMAGVRKGEVSSPNLALIVLRRVFCSKVPDKFHQVIESRSFSIGPGTVSGARLCL